MAIFSGLKHHDTKPFEEGQPLVSRRFLLSTSFYFSCLSVPWNPSTGAWQQPSVQLLLIVNWAGTLVKWETVLNCTVVKWANDRKWSTKLPNMETAVTGHGPLNYRPCWTYREHQWFIAALEQVGDTNKLWGRKLGSWNWQMKVIRDMELLPRESDTTRLPALFVFAFFKVKNKKKKLIFFFLYLLKYDSNVVDIPQHFYEKNDNHLLFDTFKFLENQA